MFRSSRRNPLRRLARPWTKTPGPSSASVLTERTLGARVESKWMDKPPMDGSGPQLSRTRRLVVLAICCFSLLMVGLDTTIVNVALPSIRNELHASISGLQWVIDAYTLVLASLLLLAGSTADRIGR